LSQINEEKNRLMQELMQLKKELQKIQALLESKRQTCFWIKLMTPE